MLAALAATTNGIITLYSGANAPEPRIEAITDRGPILEMIVRCRTGSAIISYSKLERLYCDPRLRCDANQDTVIRRTCG